MSSEREKMLAGELYDPFAPELVEARRRARLLTSDLNATRDDQPDQRRRLIRQLIPRSGEGVWIEPPFFCDYGDNIVLGDGAFFNFNCVILDVAPVRIGTRVMCGPAVQIYAATHPLDIAGRRTGLELGRPVVVGDEVWLGGGSIVCPGVTIGARSVIGAGSVVTRDIPPDVIAAGNPCRVLRSLPV